MDWKFAYNAYPVNQNLIWLNNCGTTPAGTHIVQAVSRFIQGYSEHGLLTTETANYDEVKKRIKAIIAGLLGCQPDELGLIHNTAEGMNFISYGLSFKPEDEIILLENEYPSNVYPWRHCENKGVKLVTAPMCDSPDTFLKELTLRLTDKTRIMTLSAVHWCTGMPLPIDQAGALCREKGIELVIDGAQGVGMRLLDVKQANIDYMAFPAWKWLLGPLGLGVIYISGQNLDKLDPVFIGAGSVVRDEEYLPYKNELKPGADRYTFSTANFTDWVYFCTALEFLESVGFDKVRERIAELSAYLSQGLKKIGFNVFSDRFPDYPTGIVVCEKPGTPSHVLIGHLKKNKIVAAERLGRIRFSPHIYNSFEQLDEVVKVLA